MSSPVAEEGTAEPGSLNGSTSGPTALDRACILVIDDSAQDRELIERELRRVATEVVLVTVRDPSELEGALSGQRFDLAITDYQLHWSTGLEVLKRLKQHSSELPVVMFTASGSEEIAVEAMKEGLDDYLTKTVQHYPKLPFVAAAALERRRARRQLMDALGRSELRLRAAMSIGTVGVLFFRLDGTILDANATFARMSGYTAAELRELGHWKALTAPDFYAATEAAARNVSTRGETAPYEKQMIRKDGGRWWGLFAPTRLSGSGAGSECVEFIIDITQWKHAEVARRLTEERYRTLVQNLRDYAIMLLDTQGLITEWSEGAERVFGYRPEDIVGRSVALLFSPEELDENALARDLATAMQEDRVEREHWQVRKSGERIWVNEIATAVRGESGEVVGFTKIARNLTHRRRHEEQLREADRRKDQFLAILAHELRNPLAPLKNGLQILRLRRGADSPLGETLQMMDRQLNHLVHLVDDLLDVARISSGKVVLRTRPVLLREVLAQSIEASRSLIEARDHKLSLEVSDDDMRVDGDADRLAQIFSNLLSNAAKYTEAGGEIGVRLRQDGGEAVVDVVDRGIGIPPDELERVFDLFSQVREHQGRAEGGLGIGLSLVQSLVRLHGGSVRAESEGPGRGSAFTVRLPLAQAESRAADPEPQPALTRASTPRRILVADDNVDAATSLASLLRLGGHDVTVVHDGREAIEMATRERPEVVCLDLGMPGVDGIQAATEIRRNPATAGALLIALTGWGQPADRERTRQAGFDAHLVKPVEFAQVAAVIAEMMRDGAVEAKPDPEGTFS